MRTVSRRVMRKAYVLCCTLINTFLFLFNWKKRHEEFEKNCESRGFKPGPLFDSLTEDAKNMVRWHTSDKYPDPLMEGAADEALILDWVNFWIKPPTSLKSNW